MTNRGRFAVTWADLVLVLLLTACALEAWTGVSGCIGRRLCGSEPRKEVCEERRHVPRLEHELAIAQSEWQAVVARLAQLRLDKAQLEAQLAVLLAADRSAPAAGAGVGTKPSAPGEALAQVRLQLGIQAAVISRLEATLGEAEPRYGERLVRLEQARHDAELDLAKEQEEFEWRRRLEVLVGAALAAGAILGVAVVVLLGSRAGAFRSAAVSC